MKKLFMAAVFIGLTVAALEAGGLSKKYRNWDKSPQAYFMTSSEKTAWKQVKSDSDAQNFILDYMSRRGPNFEENLNKAIAVADRYFSSGETKGSETLRGKIIIVFGPPSDVDRSQGAGGEPGSQANSSNLTGGGRGGGSAGTTSSFGAGATSGHSASVETPTFSLIYDDAHAPKAIGKGFRIDLEMLSNAEQKPINAKDLDSKLEQVSEASIVAPDAKH